MYAASDVTDEPWQTALARMNLQLIRPPVPETNDSAQTENVVV
jgi:hypothetical protein